MGHWPIKDLHPFTLHPNPLIWLPYQNIMKEHNKIIWTTQMLYWKSSSSIGSGDNLFWGNWFSRQSIGFNATGSVPFKEFLTDIKFDLCKGLQEVGGMLETEPTLEETDGDECRFDENMGFCLWFPFEEGSFRIPSTPSALGLRTDSTGTSFPPIWFVKTNVTWNTKKNCHENSIINGMIIIVEGFLRFTLRKYMKEFSTSIQLLKSKKQKKKRKGICPNNHMQKSESRIGVCYASQISICESMLCTTKYKPRKGYGRCFLSNKQIFIRNEKRISCHCPAHLRFITSKSGSTCIQWDVA